MRPPSGETFACDRRRMRPRSSTTTTTATRRDDDQLARPCQLKAMRKRSRRFVAVMVSAAATLAFVGHRRGCCYSYGCCGPAGATAFQQPSPLPFHPPPPPPPLPSSPTTTPNNKSTARRMLRSDQVDQVSHFRGAAGKVGGLFRRSDDDRPQSDDGGWGSRLFRRTVGGRRWGDEPRRRRRRGRGRERGGGGGGSVTALNMVLTTPESIIEQASTENLLDDLIDESVRTSSRKPIMMQFEPSSGWIWRRWRGTVFSETWTSCVRNMFGATLVALFYQANPGFKERLSGFNILWGQLLSVTTFTLTFFLNVSYALWRKCYELSRRLQGRLNDLGMTLASHAARTTPSSPDDVSTYTAPARQVLDLVSRYIRVFNMLTYASFTRSHRPILTPRGMRRLVERGILTPMEHQVLADAEVPATQRHNAVIMWIIRIFVEGRQAGHFVGGAGFEQQFMEKCHVIRAQYGAIGDELQGRMPLAYAHIVQVLVDVILWMYPFMAFSTGMTPLIGVVGTGLLTMFYQGLFDLAKQFLDPYDNENYGKGEDPLCVDTLVAETNAGSVRWLKSFNEQPFSSQRLKDGELSSTLLPLRGYSLEELREAKEREEAEKLKKEKELREKKEREEAERLLREQEERERMMEEEAELALKNIPGDVNATISSDSSARSAVEAAEQPVDSLLTTQAEFSGGLSEVGSDESKVEGKVEEKTTVHTVLSLECGTPVTLDDNETDTLLVNGENVTAIENDMGVLVERAAVSPADFAASNATKEQLGAEPAIRSDVQVVNGDRVMNGERGFTSDDQNGLKPTSAGAAEGEGADIYRNLNLIPFDPYSDLEWFDEVGPDGQEYRLSQMLADEVWDEELEKAASEEKGPITFEDYAQQATAIIEEAEDELLETEEILRASPGADAPVDAKKKKPKTSQGAAMESLAVRVDRKEKAAAEKKALYDQTRLDGISQLWGAPPEVLDLPVSDEPAKSLAYEDFNFDGISALWGEAPTSSQKAETSESVKAPAFEGVSALWGETLSGTRRSSTTSATGDYEGVLGKGMPSVNSPPYAELEWFDEVGPDGQEYRLSQMLADEEWEEEVEPEVEAPLTFEDYAKQATVILEAAEDERLETEAILNAPPGASSLDNGEETEHDDFKDTALPAVATESAEKLLADDDDDMLDILEMDVGEEEPSTFENTTSSSDAEVSATLFGSGRTSGLFDSNDDDGSSEADEEITAAEQTLTFETDNEVVNGGNASSSTLTDVIDNSNGIDDKIHDPTKPMLEDDSPDEQ